MTTSAASARLVATLTAPLDRDRDAAYAPSVLRWPDRRLLIQRGDFEAVAVDLDDPSAPQTRFPAPWPRRFGTFTVAPGGDLAVFAGVHSVRAVDPAGAVRWEVRHGCWEGGCRILHASFEEYADSRSHLYADSGSAVFSADGSLVWAHIRGPVATAARIRRRSTSGWSSMPPTGGCWGGRMRRPWRRARSTYRIPIRRRWG